MATQTPQEGELDQRRTQAVTTRLVSLRHQLGILGIVLLGLVPTVMKPSELTSFTFVLYLMMFAISWDVVSGYTGQLSFGHAFFFALGGYGTSIITTQHGLPIFVGIVGGTLVATIGGVLLGVPALRLEGPYLSLVTLIAPLLLYQSFVLFSDGIPYLAPEGLGGTSGLVAPPPEIIDIGSGALIQVDQFWVSALGKYYISFLALLVVLGSTYAFTRSSAGNVLTAIREDEAAVRSVGLNPAKFKIFAFVFSAAVGGFAAAVWMHAGPSAFPNTEAVFGPGRIDKSINVIIIAIIGGMGTIVGSVVGALFFGFADTVIGGLDIAIPGVELLFGSELTIADTSPLPTFLLGMIVLVFLPRGVVPEATEFGRRLLARRRGEEPPPGGGRSPVESTLAKYRREVEDILGRDGE